MTPAIYSAKKAKIEFQVHEYKHDSGRKSYGLEAAEKLKVDASRVFKTLGVELNDSNLAVAIIPVSSKLQLKNMARAVGSKKAKMAERAVVERSTGYVAGGISPLGQKKRLPTIIDSSAVECCTMFVSGGRRGIDIELKPEDLRNLVDGDYANICQVR
jgi:Cys-tRNA(Pro)/Cys-tRNA(Cys) deacylase